MSVQSSAQEAAQTSRPGDDTRRLKSVVRATAMVGGPLFLLTVIAHPARDGHDIAAHAQWYAFTHSMEAIGLLIQAVCLAGVLAVAARRPGARRLTALFTALVGTILWFGLIIFDGGHNPVTAKYAPTLVHTSGDIDVMGGFVVVAANIVFPLGYLLLAGLLARLGQRSAGILLAVGGLVYSLGGTAALFGFGPHSMITSVVEIAGAAPYALGYVLLGRAFGPGYVD